MKKTHKLLSAFLAVLLLISAMSATAFAADDPTTTITVEVPDNKPDYTFHCPSEVTLEYGKTDKQTVGDVYVTDVKNCDYISVEFPYTDLVNINDSSDTIPLTLFYAYPDADFKLSKGGRSGGTAAPYLYNLDCAGQYGFDSDGYLTVPVKAQVSDWTGATAGATYKATITYEVGAR